MHHTESRGDAATADQSTLTEPLHPAATDRSFSPSTPVIAAPVSAALAALLAACGGGGDSGPSGGNPSGGSGGGNLPGNLNPDVGLGLNASTFAYTQAATDEDASRFLQQAQFSASTAEIAAVRASSYAAWLLAQMDAKPTMTGVEWLDSRGYSAASSDTSYFDHTYPADFMIWQQLMAATDAVRKRLALALSEIFVVSLSSTDVEWRSHAVAKYWDILVAGTRGNFRTLLEDITLNPAMGLYLNTKGNQKEDGRGRQPDENYAREVMQLFTLGLYQLNPDGSEKRGADGAKLPAYTQSDVTNLARVFTGYDLDSSQSVRTTLPGTNRSVGNTSPVLRPMVLNPARHSNLAAEFLGASVPANTSGAAALKTGLDTLFNHANVGPFIGKQLIQRLVTSNPSPAYVARVAAVFNSNKAGVRGDMKSVFAAVLLDDEARGPAGMTSPTFGKLREPMVRFVQWGRTFGLDSAAGSWKLDQQGNADQLGQSPLRAPSVFNFYRPGYVPPSTAIAASDKVAPEFQTVNETTVGAYLNYMQERIRTGFYIDSPNAAQHTYRDYVVDMRCSYSGELALVQDAAALVRRLSLLMCAGQLSAATQGLMVRALNATPLKTTGSAENMAASRLDRVAAAVLMVMASSEYLVQK